ncbi:MAG: pyruvate carboxyltransferase, partial [Desulfobacteraceae bacterium]|nr:pyruvate carboxyltransferase [Desulfobacteraceae bacterium]
LWLGRQLEKSMGKRLRSEAMINGRTLKEGHMAYARPGLKELKAKLNEKPDQKLPE